MALIKIWIQTTPSSIVNTRWFGILLCFMVILGAGLAGSLFAGISGFLAGREVLIPWAVLGLGLALFLSVFKFDFMVLMSFCLFGMVRIEPAPTDMLVMLLFPIGILSGKLSLKTLRDSPLIHLLLLGYIVTNFISMIYVNEVIEGVRYLFITGYLIVLFYFVKMYATSFQARRTVMIGYLASALASVFLIALGYLGIGTDIFLEFNRASGLFKDANVFGPFLILAILFLIDEVLQPQIFRGFFVAKILGISALGAGVFLSGSRAAWGNLTLALLIYLILTIKSRPKIIAPVLIVAIIGLMFLPFLSTWLGSLEFIQGFLEDRAKFQAYDVSRFGRQLEGIQVGMTHLLGLGPGMWSSAHSLYVRTFAENGIFGFATLMFLLLVLSIGTFFRAFREINKPCGISAKVVLGCLLGHLMNSFVIDTIHWRHFWFILALAWVTITTETQAFSKIGNHRIE